MSRTENFRKQHRELEAIVGAIAGPITNGTVAKEAAEIRKNLSLLAGKLTVHLGMEDNVLYPELAKSTDTAVSSTAAKFQAEMGGIKAAFTAYVGKWPSSAAIEADPKTFANDTLGIVKALADRIAREESDLYKKADAAQIK